MGDPSGMSMVVNSALPATFTFLYQQLDHLLSGRSRRSSNRGADPADEIPKVPSVLVSQLDLPLHGDQDQVQARINELRAYALGLAPYRENPTLVTSEDQQLLETLSALRDALEGIYGQRLTFEGESRDQSAPRSVQRHGKVSGEVVGMEAVNSIHGPASTEIETESVEPGGRVIGMRARDIGSSR